MTTIKHAGQNGLTLAVLAAGATAAIFAARFVAGGLVYLGSLAF